MTTGNASSSARNVGVNAESISEEALLRDLPSFKSADAVVNGVRLHYVEGGTGKPLFLLPGWPQTWWQFSRTMEALSKTYRVVALDLRGMGGSEKPETGYDKKTMATDVLALAKHLGFEKVSLAGNDVGSMVAYAFAANFPQNVDKLVMLDAPHPFAGFEGIPLIPPPGAYDLSSPSHIVHPWWWSFSQLSGLHEALVADRYHLIQEWTFDYLAADKASITPRDRAVYAAAYAGADAHRAVRGWFAAFPQDIADAAAYGKLQMPVLGIGGISFDYINAFLGMFAEKATIVRFEKTGHWIPDERPTELVAELIKFLG